MWEKLAIPGIGLPVNVGEASNSWILGCQLMWEKLAIPGIGLPVDVGEARNSR